MTTRFSGDLLALIAGVRVDFKGQNMNTTKELLEHLRLNILERAMCRLQGRPEDQAETLYLPENEIDFWKIKQMDRKTRRRIDVRSRTMRPYHKAVDASRADHNHPYGENMRGIFEGKRHYVEFEEPPECRCWPVEVNDFCDAVNVMMQGMFSRIKKSGYDLPDEISDSRFSDWYIQGGRKLWQLLYDCIETVPDIPGDEMSVIEIADACGCSERTVRRAINKKFPARKIKNNKWMISLSKAKPVLMKK